MTTEHLLTDIEHPGTVIVPHNYDRRHALAIHIESLQKQGHAIGLGETVDAGHRGDLGELIVYHYSSCKKCRKSVL